MGEEVRMVIPGVQARVPDVCDFVVAAARRANLNERAVYHCQMAVDEACTNIIEHGYGGDSHEGLIHIVCRDDPDRYSISIIDDSPLFNPLAKADPSPDTPLTEREPGGWGIFFIKKMMENASYSLTDGLNTLTITKHKTPETTIRPADQMPEQQIVVRRLADDIQEIVPHKRLDSNTAPYLQAALSDQLEAGHTRLVVNMSQVDYISTSGLKVLVNAWRHIREHSGKLVLTSMTIHVSEVFETVGFDQVFDIVDTLDDALQQFSDQAA